MATISTSSIQDGLVVYADHPLRIIEALDGTNANTIIITGDFIQGVATNTTDGSTSFAQGDGTEASGLYSHAEGDTTVASGNYSHAEGFDTTASNTYAHAEGSSTVADGDHSHAEGNSTNAAGMGSHAEGKDSAANGDYSHAEGWGTIAEGDYQHATGQYNKASNTTDYFVVGVGANAGARADGLGVNASRTYISNSLYLPNITTGNYSNVILIDSTTGQLYYTASNALTVGTNPGIGTDKQVQYISGSTLTGTGSFIYNYTTQILYYTGSQKILGSISASSGANTIGFYGTSSWAQSASVAISSSYALSSSYTLSSSYAISSSYTLSSSYAESASIAVSSSYVLSSSYSISSSYALSASYAPGAGSVGSNLTQGVGIASFTYNGGSTQTVAIKSASIFQDNVILKWDTGASQFESSSLTDNGTIITGSTSIRLTGTSSILTGSFTGSFVGSLIGTASWAESASVAISSSYALSSSYTLSSSYAVSASNALSSSYVLSSSYSFSGSYALTASYALNGGGSPISVYNGNTGASYSNVTTLYVSGSGVSVSTPSSGIVSMSIAGGGGGGGATFPYTGDAVISGSLTITGSGLVVTGSIKVRDGITGSLFGTSSWAESASVAISSSYSLTSSYVISSSYAFSASYALSSSYALTSSYALFALSASARGSNTQIQINSSSVLIGTSSFTFNYQSQSLQQGSSVTASGLYSHAEGSQTWAIGNYSHAEGIQTWASGTYSHAEGNNTQALGPQSHAEGYNTRAIGNGAHAEGRETFASGAYSHAVGTASMAKGDYSYAGGQFTIASGSGQTVVGQYNKQGNSIDLFVVGNGTSDSLRSDIFTVGTSHVGISSSISASLAANVIGFFGTASWAQSASRAITSSYALTASYALNALPSSPTRSIQFSNGGAFGGSGNFIFDSSTSAVSLTGSMYISSSGGNQLQVAGSGSQIISTYGSQGQLLTVTDDLTGSLLSVRDISGVPVFEANANSNITLGNYASPALFTTTSSLANTGWTTTYTTATSSYLGLFIDWVSYSGSGTQMSSSIGTTYVLWAQNAGLLSYNNNTEAAVPSTLNPLLYWNISASLDNSGNARIQVSGSITRPWNTRLIIRGI